MASGKFERCPMCREWGWFGGASFNHFCKPAWECRIESTHGDDEWKTIHARDAEEAAEKFAEHYDCEGGEYAIVSNPRSDWVIQVRKPGDETHERWSIEAETVPQYRAARA
jgi:hypothetical protein